MPPPFAPPPALKPPPRVRPVSPGFGGFGPAGSGSFHTGTTPMPLRAQDEHPELPTEKDLERKRPAYLVEGDDDEMFGTGEFTAPPVIGE